MPASDAPPVKLARRLARAAGWRAKAQWHAQRDGLLGTFPRTPAAPLATLLAPLAIGSLQAQAARIRDAADAALAHRFDVLGSGPMEVRHGVPCQGFEGHVYPAPPPPAVDADGRWLQGLINASNLDAARALWRLVDAGYVPIDWQRDLRSGHRWQERTWQKRIRFGHLPGVDVKVAWELARMQHLPALALAHALAREGAPGLAAAEVYGREFRNQVLDFIATNPPRYGVNWACPMEVAIRLSNWLLARDLFVAHGARFDDAFERELARSVAAHAAHVFAHQEWHPVIRGNHYLSHMAGLVFAGAWLPDAPGADAWLLRGTRELLHEIEYQFNADGSNFEASTSYHRLSGEIAAFTLAAALRVPAARWQSAGAADLHAALRAPALGARLAGIADYLVALARPDGGVPMLGDNDSGRFVRLLPARPDEDDIDAAGLQSLFAGLLSRGDAAGDLSAQVLRSLGGGARYELPAPAAAGEGHRHFPDAGVQVHRRDGWYVFAACGPNGVNGHGGHAHNDKLSFELALDGVTFFTDSGSYVYTAAPDLRNAFRATAAHNTLAVDGAEQNGWPPGARGVFVLANRAREAVLQADESAFEGRHAGFGSEHRRRLELTERGLRCDDWFDDPRPSRLVFNLAAGTEVDAVDDGVLALRRRGVTLRLHLVGFGRYSVVPGLESPRYGVRHERPRLLLPRSAAHTRVEFERG